MQTCKRRTCRHAKEQYSSPGNPKADTQRSLAQALKYNRIQSDQCQLKNDACCSQALQCLTEVHKALFGVLETGERKPTRILL
eukprot:1160001-Pelagomonas_calceolata.AAC.4